MALLSNAEATELHKKIWNIIMKTSPSMIQQIDLVRELAAIIHEFEDKEEWHLKNGER